jgi:RHS repeat-associated protein
MPGQDYADQRYFNGTIGRFWTPDPGGMASANPGDPRSWNRYTYVGGDPVNYNDPSGLCGVDTGGEIVDDAFGGHAHWRALDCGGGDDAGGGDGPVFTVTGTGIADPDDPDPVQIAFAPQPPTPMPRPPVPTPPTAVNADCPQQFQNFFNLMVPIANSLAATWNTNANFILALSAYESGWDPVYSGASHNTPINNPFGLTNAGGPDLTFPTLQDAANFWSANDGKYIQGTQTIAAFATAIQPHYNTKNPVWKTKLMQVYNSVLQRRKKCN